MSHRWLTCTEGHICLEGMTKWDYLTVGSKCARAACPAKLRPLPDAMLVALQLSGGASIEEAQQFLDLMAREDWL